MEFSKLADYFLRLEKTPSRNDMTVILADLLKTSEAQEVGNICNLSLGRLAPLYSGIEFNMAEKLLIRVIALSFKEPEEKVGKKYKETGDMGDAAIFFKKEVSGKSIKVNEVHAKLLNIAVQSGAGSVERKIFLMSELFVALDKLSVKYLARIPLGKLRLGFSELTILDALSWMIAGDKSRREEIETAYNRRADIGQIAAIIKEKGLAGLKSIKVSLGTPIMPALSQRLPSPEEMISKMGKVAAEPKFDGTRVQIHFSRKKTYQKMEDQIAFDFKPKGFIQTFTRNLENTTHMFPDLIEAIFQELGVEEAILDGEAIGFNRESGKFLPFQETIKRKRKHDINQTIKEIPLKYFCFDILYQDGQDLLSLPFFERRKLLEKALPVKNKKIILTPQIITQNPQTLRDYHDEQIKKGLEGIMIKKYDGCYEPGRRGFSWVKYKQEQTKKGGGLADTLDCLVMGYYAGRGKRANFGIGGFLAGIKKNGTDEYFTISKIGTGLSDEQWREIKEKIDRHKSVDMPKEYLVGKGLVPDVWCDPAVVVEIQADNITNSPLHTAGFALRFPRLVRFRDDRSPQEVTTFSEMQNLFKLQG